jgi:hypothetical protein
MQGKWPDQTLGQAFGLPEVLVAVSTSRLSCKRAEETRTLMPVWDSSGESRLRRLVYIDPSEVKNGFRINCYGFHPLGTDKPCPEFIDAQWKLFLRRTKNMVRFHRINGTRAHRSAIPLRNKK